MSQSGVQDAVYHAREERQRLVARGHLSLMQKHEINVTVRAQFGAAVAADRHDGDGRELPLGLGREAVAHRLPQAAQENVQQARAATGDFQPAAAAAMENLEPVRFNLQKSLVPGQFHRRQPSGRQREACGRAGFHLLNKR